MKHNAKFIQNSMGNYYFDFDGTIIILWNSGRSLISLNSFEQRFDFEQKMFESNEESILQFILSHAEFIAQYIETSNAKLSLLSTYANLPVKHLVARCADGILITQIDLRRGYVSVTGSIVCPQDEDSLIEQSKEMYVEMFMSEENLNEKDAELKFDELVRYEGVHGVSDCSLFTDSFTHEGTDFYFSYSACGCLHDEIKTAHPELTALIGLHLKDSNNDMIHAIYLLYLIEANDNYDNEVIELGKNIVSQVA